MPYHTPITEYTVLPAKCRVIYPEGHGLPPDQAYVNNVDTAMQYSSPEPPGESSDLISLIFAHQVATAQGSSRHAARLLVERGELARRHLDDIQWRLEELLEHKPLLRGYTHDPLLERQWMEVHRQIRDLEKQKRDVQLNLWRDTIELRQGLVKQRQDYHDLERRINMLGGGSDNAGA